MMKKVKWTCSKFENRVAHLGILGLKIAILALKVMHWPNNPFREINLSCLVYIHIITII